MVIAHSYAQVTVRTTLSDSLSHYIPSYSQVGTITTQTISYTPTVPPPPITPVDGDTTHEFDDRYNYGSLLTTSYGIASGNMTATSSGKVWTLCISIPNALNIGLNFSQLSLSSAAQMFIYSTSKTVLKGPITSTSFASTANGIGISAFEDRSVTIYIVEVGNTGAFQSTLTISSVIAGFQHLYQDSAGTAAILRGSSSTYSFQKNKKYSPGLMFSPSVSCDPQMICTPLELPYAKSVAIMFNGGYQCTCTLLNNEQNNGRPFILTSGHCIDFNENGTLDANELAALATAVFHFKYWSPQCGVADPIVPITSDFTGATLRSFVSSGSGDMALLELNNPPGVGDGLNFIGWNRSTSAPTSSVILHHPQGFDMRVSRSSNVHSYLFNSNYWQAYYFSGTTDKGSSGSALLNDNGQVIGQLRGGWSNCNFTDFSDRYGKLGSTWGYGALQQWLSPTQNLSQSGPWSFLPL